ncbi:MAG: hypothetical protein R2699_05800 [Acidimicrobiales bacterium]
MALCAGTLLSTAVAIPAAAAVRRRRPSRRTSRRHRRPSTGSAPKRRWHRAGRRCPQRWLPRPPPRRAPATPVWTPRRWLAAAAGHFTLELTDGVAVTVHGDGAPVPGAGDTTTWSGTTPDGYATFTFAGDQVFGDVTVAGTRYDVAPTGTGSTHLVTVEQRAFPPEDPRACRRRLRRASATARRDRRLPARRRHPSCVC